MASYEYAFVEMLPYKQHKETLKQEVKTIRLLPSYCHHHRVFLKGKTHQQLQLQ